MIKITVYRDVFGDCSLIKPKDRYSEGLLVGLANSTTFHESPDGTLYFIGQRHDDGKYVTINFDNAVGYKLLRVLACDCGYEHYIRHQSGTIKYLFVSNSGLFLVLRGQNIAIIRQKRHQWAVNNGL